MGDRGGRDVNHEPLDEFSQLNSVPSRQPDRSPDVRETGAGLFADLRKQLAGIDAFKAKDVLLAKDNSAIEDIRTRSFQHLRQLHPDELGTREPKQRRGRGDDSSQYHKNIADDAYSLLMVLEGHPVSELYKMLKQRSMLPDDSVLNSPSRSQNDTDTVRALSVPLSDDICSIKAEIMGILQRLVTLESDNPEGQTDSNNLKVVVDSNANKIRNLENQVSVLSTQLKIRDDKIADLCRVQSVARDVNQASLDKIQKLQDGLKGSNVTITDIKNKLACFPDIAASGPAGAPDTDLAVNEDKSWNTSVRNLYSKTEAIEKKHRDDMQYIDRRVDHLKYFTDGIVVALQRPPPPPHVPMGPPFWGNPPFGPTRPNAPQFQRQNYERLSKETSVGSDITINREEDVTKSSLDNGVQNLTSSANANNVNNSQSDSQPSSKQPGATENGPTTYESIPGDDPFSEVQPRNYSKVFIGGIGPKAPDENVKEFINSHGFHIKSIYIKQSLTGDFRYAKVKVASAELDAFLHNVKWPHRAYATKWQADQSSGNQKYKSSQKWTKDSK